ncbi:MAG: DUF4350 domain-containing protein [Chitinophagaceae bacterium]
MLVLLVAAFVLYKPEKKFDKKVTLNRKDTRPYATSICYNSLTSMFRNCKIKVNNDEPYEWYNYDSIKNGGNLLFLVSQRFNPNTDDLELLHEFVSNGNYIFISSSSVNSNTTDYFDVKYDYSFNTIDFNDNYYDSVNTTLKLPFYNPSSTYFNAGFSSGMYFKELDSTKYTVLGCNVKQEPNFIRGKIKNGMVFFHSDPFLFCNYFITQKNNDEYFEKVIAAIPNNVTKIIWDDYYTYKRDGDKKQERSPFRILFSYPAFLWAFAIAISLFIIYFLVNFKRKQRLVKAKKNVQNDSLYFVQTIGRLYFQKGDHINLANKMVAYFLEHIRSKYFINTSSLNNELVSKLSLKSGYPEDKTYNIIQTVVDIQSQQNITQEQLNKYYTIFQNFYKHTT